MIHLRLNAIIFVSLFIGLSLGIVSHEVSGQTVAPQSEKSADEVSRQWKRAGFKFDKGWKPVTDLKVAKAWGEKLDKTIKTRDMGEISKLIDFSPVIEQCVVGITDEAFRKGFLVGINSGTKNVLSQFADENSSYLFRGVRNDEFGACALMRLIDANGACNYHLWRLQQNENNDVVGIDMYVFVSGESFGETMRRITLLSVPKDDRSFFQKLTGTEKTLTKSQGEMLKILEGTQKKDYALILESYAKLPAKLKKVKSIMLMRMMAAMQGDEDEYVKALEDYKKQHPNDVSADLAGIDLYFLKKQYKEMQESIDRLEKAVGEDGHLGMLRGVGYTQEGKFDKAKQSLEKAISIEPELESPYWTLVQLGLTQKDFTLVTETLKKLVDKFGYSEFGFAENDLYAEYVKSDQYKEFDEFLKTAQ